MGRGSGRGPGKLRFRALLDCIAEGAKTASDGRDPTRVRLEIQDFYLSAFALFFLQDPSVLEFQRRFQDELQVNNLRSVFGIQHIPSDTHLRDLLDVHPAEFLPTLFDTYLERLQRSKLLERFRFLPQGYLLTLDGSEYFASEAVSCKTCLVRHKSNGKVEYYHQILQPALVHPEFRQVLPLSPEFIRKQDGQSKQDCEINAAKRLLASLRAKHPQLSAIVVGDGLYSTTPFTADLTSHRFHYLLVAKPEDHKSLFQDIEGLRRGRILHSLVRPEAKGKRFIYEWADQVALGADAKSPLVNFVQLSIIDSAGKVTYRNSWVTDLPIDETNVEVLVRAARARWKIENEAFNTLKNQGYHLEHNFGHGKNHLSETLFLLNLLAFFVHQIQELVDEWYRNARACFSSRREFWNAIRAAFRMLLFNSWDEVLSRITGPPMPAFAYTDTQA